MSDTIKMPNEVFQNPEDLELRIIASKVHSFLLLLQAKGSLAQCLKKFQLDICCLLYNVTLLTLQNNWPCVWSLLAITLNPITKSIGRQVSLGIDNCWYCNLELILKGFYFELIRSFYRLLQSFGVLNSLALGRT